jgi:hypothetical protein
MKTIFALFTITTLISACGKKEVKPAPTPKEPGVRLFNWNATGFKGTPMRAKFLDRFGNTYTFDCKRIDSCEIFVNSVLTYSTTY